MVKKIVEFPDQSVIEQEAAEWLVALDRDEKPSAEFLSEMTAWMARSKAHRGTLIKLNQFMSDTSLTDLMVPLEHSAHQTASNPVAEKSSWFDKLFAWPVMGGALASFVGVMMIVFMTTQTPTEQHPYTDTNGTFISALGQQRNITLADGSVITLNSNSKVNVSFDESTRDIQLVRGQAHFDVAHDKQIPFRVYGAQGRVEAVGTAFTVKVKEQSLDVLVTEGTVAVASTGNPQSSGLIENIEPNLVELGLLTAGKRVVVDTVAEIAQSLSAVKDALNVDMADITRMQAWRDGMLVFSGETLEYAVDEIRNLTGYKIEIVDSELKSIKVAGSFQTNDIDSIFASLESNFPIRISKVGYQQIEIMAAD